AGKIPYIDFHYGKGAAQDFNTRIINDADKQLTVQGNLRVVGNLTATGTASFPPSGTAGGDLTGTYPNPQLNTDSALLKKVSGNPLVAFNGYIGIDKKNESGTYVAPPASPSIGLQFPSVLGDKLSLWGPSGNGAFYGFGIN